MSLADRQRLVSHQNIVLNDVQRADFLREAQPGVLFSGTQSQLVALHLELADAGFIWQSTMVQSGHHDDGPHGHAGGYGSDGWPLKSHTPSDWMDATDPRFEQFVYAVGKSIWAYQEGLTGDGSDSDLNFHYAEKGFIERGVYVPGVSTFEDGGGPHLHLGANGF